MHIQRLNGELENNNKLKLNEFENLNVTINNFKL